MGGGRWKSEREERERWKVTGMWVDQVRDRGLGVVIEKKFEFKS